VGVDEVLISDDELALEALAADPDAAIPDDAVSLWELEAPAGAADLLPSWYMPAPAASGPRQHATWRRRTVYALITAFTLINAAGLCSTYGHIVIA
jgi:hypothetical protein